MNRTLTKTLKRKKKKKPTWTCTLRLPLSVFVFLTRYYLPIHYWNYLLSSGWAYTQGSPSLSHKHTHIYEDRDGHLPKEIPHFSISRRPGWKLHYNLFGINSQKPRPIGPIHLCCPQLGIWQGRPSSSSPHPTTMGKRCFHISMLHDRPAPHHYGK